MFSRRNFLKIGGLALSGGVLLSADTNIFAQIADKADGFPIPPEVFANRSSSFTAKTFEPLLETVFEVSGGENVASVSLRLVEVVGNEFKNGHRIEIPTDGFLLIFETVGKGNLEDQIYEIEHPELGTFSLFLSTVGRSGKRYQAVFTRIYA